MKTTSTTAALLVLLLAAPHGYAKKPRGFDFDDYEVTDRQIVEEISSGMFLVNFTLTKKVPRGKFLVTIPKAVFDQEFDTAWVHLPGDDMRGRERKQDDYPHRLASHGSNVVLFKPVITVSRPHGEQKSTRRQWRELGSHMAVMKHLHQEFGITKACLSGWSSGGAMVVGLTQEMSEVLPNLEILAVRIASSALSIESNYSPMLSTARPARAI